MRRLPARLAVTCIAAALAFQLVPAPAAAQSVRTFAQMQQQFRNLPPRQIQMCDRNGDGVYDRGEQACVSSVNDAMRQNR